MEDAKPTPETLKKIRYDVLFRAFQGGSLPASSWESVIEIRSVCQALFSVSISSISDTPLQKHKRRASSDPLSTMTENQERWWRTHYVPWTRGELNQNLMHDIINDNMGFNQADKKYRRRKGSSKTLVQISLNRFARLAGYCD